MRDDRQGIVQIYCGEGKGKTTAAVGQAVRAAGNGFSVAFVQFLKKAESGESDVLDALTGIDYHAFGSGRFLFSGGDLGEDKRLVKEALAYIHDRVESRRVDMVVMDEAGGAIELGLMNNEAVTAILDEGDGWLDVVITGRTFADILMDRADLVTRMECIRHPFNDGVSARRGIEF